MFSFPTQEWPCHDNIVTDRDLNLFHGTTSSWGNSKIYVPGAIAISQTDRAPTKINKNVAVVKVRILVELGIL